MPSSYTVNNGLEKIGTGEQSGTWGTTTNVNFDILDQALDGQVTISATTTGTSQSPNELSILDGSTSNGRNRALRITSPSDLGGDVFFRLNPSNAKKIIFVRNDLAGQERLVLFQGVYDARRSLIIDSRKDALVQFDGGGNAATVTHIFNNLYLPNVTINSGNLDNIAIGATTPATRIDVNTLNVDNLNMDGNSISSTDEDGNIILNPNGTGDIVLDVDSTGRIKFGSSTSPGVNLISTDGTFDSPSDDKLVTEQAIKTYVDSQSGGGTVGNLNQVLNQGNTTGGQDIIVNGTSELRVADTASVDINSDCNIGNLLLSGNSLTAQNIGGGISLVPNGTGKVFFGTSANGVDDISTDGTFEGITSNATLVGQTAIKTYVDNKFTGSVGTLSEVLTQGNATNGTGQSLVITSGDSIIIQDGARLDVDGNLDPGNLRLTGNIISSISGDIKFSPAAAGNVVVDTSNGTRFSIGVGSSLVYVQSISSDGGFQFASNEALATQLAIKTYVDAQFGATVGNIRQVLTQGDTTNGEDLVLGGDSQLQVRSTASVDINGSCNIGNLSFSTNDITAANQNGSISLIPTGNGKVNLGTSGTAGIDTVSNDDAFANASASALATQLAIKTYVGNQVTRRGVPTGTVIDFTGLTVPSGWLVCAGQTVSEETYSDLNAALGGSYNTGTEPTGEFRLPDLGDDNAPPNLQATMVLYKIIKT